MEIIPLKTNILKYKFDLNKTIDEVLVKNHEKLVDKDILVISSKILALSQGRLVDLSKIKPSKRAKSFRRSRYGHGRENPRLIELILKEADAIMPGNMLMALKDGVLIPEAGIDLSNAPEGFAILWPKNSWKAANALQRNLQTEYSCKNLGVIIVDSHCQPLRWGTTGLAIAWAGFEGIEDARGQKDIYGKKLQVTRKAVADNLASAALVVMGEAGEKIPFALIKNAPVPFTNRRQKRSEIFVKPTDCLFGGIYNKKFLDLLE